MNTSRYFLCASIVLGITSSAVADWDSFWRRHKHFQHEAKIDFMRNMCWPNPFTEVDAAQVRSPFNAMAHNGWRLHHTLSHDVFHEGNNVLSAVGRDRVHWIATQSPEHRRNLYVLQGRTREDTAARVASVREALTHVITDGTVPHIAVTNRIPSLTSGNWNTFVARERIRNMPAPRLGDDENAAAAGNVDPN